MPDKDNLTPERELLKLIEDEKSFRPIPKVKVTQKGLSFISLGGLKGRFSFLKSKFKSSFKKQELSLKIVNKILAVLLFFLFGTVVSDIIFSSINVKSELDKVFAVNIEPKEINFSEVVALKPSTYYLDKVRKRDLFNLITPKEKSIVQAAQEKPQVKEIEEKAKNLKLVGISWSDSPDAMVEDTVAKKTFFVKQGDVIGGVIVDQIYKNKIVIRYNTETIDLQ